MDVEFDDVKDAVNIAKLGVSLRLGAVVIENRIAEIVGQTGTEEERWIAYGLVNGRLFACVYTLRGETCRLISVRKASKQEQRRWQL